MRQKFRIVTISWKKKKYNYGRGIRERDEKKTESSKISRGGLKTYGFRILVILNYWIVI